MIRFLSLERKTNEHGGYDGSSMCSRRLICYFFSRSKLLGLVDILWKTEEIGELYLVRSADENVGGSVVVISWVPEVIGKPYYVWSADENVGDSVVDVLFVIFSH